MEARVLSSASATSSALPNHAGFHEGYCNYGLLQRALRLNCWTSTYRAGQQVPNLSARTIAFASGSRNQRSSDDYVELDDEATVPTWGFGNLPVAGSQIQGAAQGVVNRIVDLAYDFTPEGVSRSVVETATKGALVLLGLAFAQTILSFLLTVGTAVLGLFLASKVFGFEISSGRLASGSQEKQRTGSTKKGGSKVPIRIRSLGDAAKNDVADVWFAKRKK